VTDDDAHAPEPAPLRDFSQSLPMALLRAREAVMREFRPLLRSLDLTEQQWRVLRALRAMSEVDATTLAQATFLLAPSLTRILRDLGDRKLIQRRARPGDQRASLVSLSATGLQLLDEAGLRSEAIYRALETRLGKARIAQIMAMLAALEGDLRAPE
jgi:homoprotocatechuate degradation regulator HpaR